jgi:glucose/arabinose dehydrogenase/chitodextrinase
VRRSLTFALVLLMVASGVAIVLPAPPVAASGQIAVYMAGLNYPIALGFASDGRIFYNERNTGSIRIIQNNVLLATPFITLPGTNTSGERGLLGLALDPGFPSAPYVYAYQTFTNATSGTTYNRIVRILASGNSGISYTVILRLPPLSAATNHNGGVIAFGPDKKLYAVVGENANPALSQDPLSPMGKVLRMNTNGTAPSDNPFYGNASWNPLVYTYGHRNMFGLAFHPVTGRPYVTENGPACNDEVNLLPNLSGPRRNFGWGPSNTCSTPPPAPNNTNQDGPNPVLPIWWWASTICPTNAAIYGGPFFPAFRGDLFMGDCNFRTFHRLHLVPPNYDTVASDTPVWVAPDIILDVEVGLDGAIWITTPTTIYRYWDSGQPPVASFTATPNPTTVGATVTFDASASSDPDGRVVSYAWDFGDLTLGSNQVTSHAYTSAGTYNVTLTVTDNESFTDTAYRNVVVQPAPPGPQPPVARFVLSPSPVNPGATVTFNASTSTDSDGTIVSYAWNFGDSSPAGSGVTTTHAYSVRGIYTATLNVTDNQSLSSEATHQVGVDLSPQAAFTSTPATLYIGVTVTFNGSTSTDDGTIVSYAWTFGDGATGTGKVATHAYASKGAFTASLVVVDDAGLSNRTTSMIVVRNRAPQIQSSSPGLGPVAVPAGSTQTFTVTASDPDGDSLTYTWRVDGSVAGGNTNSFDFAGASPGAHTVNVTVSDGSLAVSREWTVAVAGPSLFSSVWPFTLLAVVVLAAVLLVWWARRKRRPAQPPPPRM